MDKSASPPLLQRDLHFHVTKEQRESLEEEADKYGYDLSSLLRLRLLGKVKGLRIVRRPSYNTRLLGDVIGHLIGVTGAINKNGATIGQIAERLDQSRRDLFGLDGALRRFDQLGQELLRILNLIDVALKGCPHRATAKQNLPQKKELS